MAHTPGPFSVHYAGGETFRIVDSKDMDELSFLATVHFHDDQEGETRDNAKLFSAAPDLLEELRVAIACAEVGLVPEPHTLRRFRAAVRKAT